MATRDPCQREKLGWPDVPLLGAPEVDKPGAPPRCIRVLLHWNTSRRQDEIVHVYLRGSDVMRAHDPPSHLASGARPEDSMVEWPLKLPCDNLFHFKSE